MIDMKKALQSIDDVIEKGPYKDTWASLSSWQTQQKAGGFPSAFVLQISDVLV